MSARLTFTPWAVRDIIPIELRTMMDRRRLIAGGHVQVIAKTPNGPYVARVNGDPGRHEYKTAYDAAMAGLGRLEDAGPR